ncbi:HlyD family efflux transporter periplasmic adaptor subunit [Puteibacter caeruleilacunae]|nr:HlyD family efflux transporter periplasmic adaptor subunit [Puteibacter caeruleilacunae]
MKKTKSIIGAMILCATVIMCSCNPTVETSDAYGNFEAVDYIISAEASGKILQLDLEEGTVFGGHTIVGVIDTVQLYLKREQLKAQKTAIAAGVKNILSRIKVLEEQKQVAEKDQNRIKKMYEDGAVSEKSVDDIDGQIAILKRQIQSVKTENAKVLGELDAMEFQIQALTDQLIKSKIVVPQSAMVLEKYKEPYEMVTAGMPLFKLANMEYLDLRVYVSGDQLAEVKIGQTVEVLIDKNVEENQSLEGEVTWVSSQSEFTPKIIQTKKERVKLVYAVKVRVKNDGRLKIGMPGEIRFK